MGVKGISSFLKKEFPDLYLKVNIEDLAGYFIAIDALNIIHIFYATARKQAIAENKFTNELGRVDIDPDRIMHHFYWRLIEFITIWLEHKIVPIFIFDGKKVIEKKDTSDKRKFEKEKTKEKIEVLVKELAEVSLLERDSKKIDELCSLESRIVSFPPNFVNEIKQFLKLIPVPFLTAEFEGEGLCCQLNKMGIVVGVYSSDTDCLAYGAELMLNNIIYEYDEGKKSYFVTALRYSDVLEKLSFNPNQLLDLMIMCGCDFNTNIPKIGPKRSFKIITDYGNIDNLKPLNLDLTPLNYERCREIFTYCENVNNDLDKQLNFSLLTTEEGYESALLFFQNYSCESLLSKLAISCSEFLDS